MNPGPVRLKINIVPPSGGLCENRYRGDEIEPTDKNTLFYGDNLEILREYIPDESVDLIYLDPPFNSNRNYNVLFREESGKDSESQIMAFEDTWHWDRSAEDTYDELVTDSSPQISRMIGALREFIGENQMMAYLVMMTVRLVELHRVLKDTGSLYLHCDPTASHYLKVVLDTIFGVQNFKNEIIWYYRRWSAFSERFQRIHDVIFFYGKKEKTTTFNKLYEPYTDGTLKRWKGIKRKTIILEDGTLYQEEDTEGKKGANMGDVWRISILNSQSNERLGYPTQKPLELLERIVKASSNEGDLVLDPFAGCGTTIAAAEKLNRRWIGIDITHLAISLLKYRLRDMRQDAEARKGVSYQVIGEPKDIEGARRLAQDDRYQFQWWVNGLIEAKPLGGTAGSKKGKKGADRGVDGVITFIDDNSKKPKQVLVQVKSGKVRSPDIRDLVGTVEREKAAIGVFVTLEKATKAMIKEAVSAGHYRSEGWNKKYPKIQILTIEDLFNGKITDMPPVHTTFKQVRKERRNGHKQSSLEI